MLRESCGLAICRALENALMLLAASLVTRRAELSNVLGPIETPRHGRGARMSVKKQSTSSLMAEIAEREAAVVRKEQALRRIVESLTHNLCEDGLSDDAELYNALEAKKEEFFLDADTEGSAPTPTSHTPTTTSQGCPSELEAEGRTAELEAEVDRATRRGDELQQELSSVAAQLASALARLESASLRADEQEARADGLAADVAALEVERAELESRLQKSTRTRAASLASLASEQPPKRETARGDPAAPQPSEHGAESAGAAMQPEKTCVDDLEVAALTSLPHVKDAAARAWARARARALE